MAKLPATFPEALTHILQHPNVDAAAVHPGGRGDHPADPARPPGAHHHRPAGGRDHGRDGRRHPGDHDRRRLPTSRSRSSLSRTDRRSTRNVERVARHARVRPPRHGGGLPILASSMRPQRVVERFFLQVASWPALVVMLAVTAIPFAITIGLAFTNYDLVRSDDWRFIGLDNFQELVSRPADAHHPRRTRSTWSSRPPSSRRSSGSGLAVLMEQSFRGIGHHPDAVPRADHDRAHRRRAHVARDVQQRRGLDQLTSWASSACRRPSGSATRCWPCPWSSSRTRGPASRSRRILLLAALLDGAA